MDTSPLSLYQLLNRTKSVLKDAMPASYWVVAEISEMKTNYSGHCYLELIDKEKDSEQIKARARATIWSATFRMLQPYFETTTHTKLSAGLKIMIKVTVEFHELYGFSLNVVDIEPSFTIGELARKKQEIINRLIAEGVFEMNKKLSFPQIPKRLAVISSKTAAGYGDFMDQLIHNQFGYTFHVKLFPAVMQGDEAEQSIVKALEKIFAYDDFFSLVIIIRGGGAQSELNCFNGYWLASHICQFPIPVLTGIGHEQDETIADMVAHTRLKTPTAVAEYIISRFREADERINELTISLIDSLDAQLDFEKNRLSRYVTDLKPLVREKLMKQAAGIQYLNMNAAKAARQMITKHSLRISRRASRIQLSMKQLFLKLTYRQSVLKAALKQACRAYLDKQIHLINLHERKNQYLNPFKILERGYSVTYYGGKAVRNAQGIPDGAILETRLQRGKLKSKKI